MESTIVLLPYSAKPEAQDSRLHAVVTPGI
eukprot:COSAG02_NODE_57310_length_281_cov_0.582418_1_plen_29_part_10